MQLERFSRQDGTRRRCSGSGKVTTMATHLRHYVHSFASSILMDQSTGSLQTILGRLISRRFCLPRFTTEKLTTRDAPSQGGTRPYFRIRSGKKLTSSNRKRRKSSRNISSRFASKKF